MSLDYLQQWICLIFHCNKRKAPPAKAGISDEEVDHCHLSATSHRLPAETLCQTGHEFAQSSSLPGSHRAKCLSSVKLAISLYKSTISQNSGIFSSKIKIILKSLIYTSSGPQMENLCYLQHWLAKAIVIMRESPRTKASLFWLWVFYVTHT